MSQWQLENIVVTVDYNYIRVQVLKTGSNVA